MDYIRVNIITTADGIDPICSRLQDIGIDGAEIADKDDFKEFLENNRRYWDYVDEELEKLKTADTKITVYVTDDAEGEALLEKIKGEMTALSKSDSNGAYGALKIITSSVKEEDWAENWKQYFRPLSIGKNILIQPEWIPLDDEADGKTVFIVNPGMTFGTGSHDSTRFCIEEIEKYIKPGDTMLDLGCGSGILSVIALLLGAKHADAIDIDPNAVDVAYSNLALNNLPKDRCTVISGDIIGSGDVRAAFGKYDLVAANIVADVIIALAPYVRSFMKPEAVFVCSGIINERADEVAAALENAGLEIINKKQSDEWTAYTCM